MPTPVIYEVNLTPNVAIISEFRGWLDQHVAEMVALPGFIGARVLDEEEQSTDTPDTITVHYQLESRAALENYLTQNASQMRQSGIDRFGDQFSATRRILLLDPKHDSASEHVSLCLNCKAPLVGQYCSSCGQRHQARVITLWELLSSLIGDLFELDSRLWRSLIPLVTRPGFLTKEYLGGKRAYYTPPLRMYLVLSIVFFVLAIGGNSDTNDINISELEIELPDGTIVTDGNKEKLSDWCQSVDVEPRFLQDSVRSRCLEVATEGPGELIKDLSENLPKMMFFFLPLIAVFMKILYLGSKRYYVEHLLFFVHVHSAFFLMLSVGLLLEKAVLWLSMPNWIGEAYAVVITIYVPIYLWKAMRRVFGQHWFVRILKYGLLLVAYISCMLITGALGLVLTAVA